MRARLNVALILIVIMTVFLSACGGSGGGFTIGTANTVTVSIVYGSEKQEWLKPLVDQYNAAKHQVNGATIVVDAAAMGSIEAVDGIIAEQLKPTVWSPASSIYIPVANA